MATTYRLVNTIDADRLPQLMELYAGTWWTGHRTSEQVRELLKWSDLVVGLCDASDDRLVAFARVLTDRTFRAFIFDVIVAADHRGRGLGHRLMEEVLSNPLVRGAEQVELYCRPDLVQFYESLGFRRPDSGVVLMRLNSDEIGPHEGRGKP
jgi:GNAT superfamily N-acetyltransferase